MFHWEPFRQFSVSFWHHPVLPWTVPYSWYHKLSQAHWSFPSPIPTHTHSYISISQSMHIRTHTHWKAWVHAETSNPNVTPQHLLFPSFLYLKFPFPKVRVVSPSILTHLLSRWTPMHISQPSCTRDTHPHMLWWTILWPWLPYSPQVGILEPVSLLPTQPPGTSSSPPWDLSPGQPALLCGCPSHRAWALTLQVQDAPTHVHLPCSVAPNGFRDEWGGEGKGKKGEREEVNISQFDQLIKVNWAKSRQYHEASAFFFPLTALQLSLPASLLYPHFFLSPDLHQA